MDLMQIDDEKDSKTKIPPFRAGDTVRVHVKVREAEKTRIQVFQGVVLGRQGSGRSETFPSVRCQTG